MTIVIVVTYIRKTLHGHYAENPENNSMPQYEVITVLEEGYDTTFINIHFDKEDLSADRNRADGSSDFYCAGILLLVVNNQY